MAHMVNLPTCLWYLSLWAVSLYSWSLSNLSQVLHLFIMCTKIITELHNVSIIIHNTKIKQNLSVKCSHKLLLWWWIASFRWRGTYAIPYRTPCISLKNMVAWHHLLFKTMISNSTTWALAIMSAVIVKTNHFKSKGWLLLLFSLMVSDA